MRDIKFKAKRVDNGEWVSGDLMHYEKEFKKRVAIVDWNEDKDGYREVHPETVCQYTGLKDKNWKEIYEGDSVETEPNNGWVGLCKGVVKYAAMAFHIKGKMVEIPEGTYCKSGDEWFTTFTSGCPDGIARGIIVTGNIHDKEATNDN